MQRLKHHKLVVSFSQLVHEREGLNMHISFISRENFGRLVHGLKIKREALAKRSPEYKKRLSNEQYQNICMTRTRIWYPPKKTFQ